MSFLNAIFLISFLSLVSFQAVGLYKQTTCRQYEWKRDFEIKTTKTLTESHPIPYVPKCKGHLQIGLLGNL